MPASPRAAFGGAFIGYSVTQTACYVLGLLALVTVARDPDDIYGAFIAVPLGSLAFAVLAVAGARSIVRQRLLHCGVGAKPSAALGPAGSGRDHRRGDDVPGAVGQHERLRELPVVAGIGIRTAVRGTRR